MIRYYAGRATEYDGVYEIPEWQSDVAELKGKGTSFFCGRTVFEVACGTGYSTQYVALTAADIHATDVNEQTLAIARARDWPRANVRFDCLDAYIPNSSRAFLVFALLLEVKRRRWRTTR